MKDDNAEEVVMELNSEMYEKCELDILQFEYTSTGFTTAITFLGYPIWCSECDDRKWDEDKDEQEPLYDYVKKEAIELINILQKAFK